MSHPRSERGAGKGPPPEEGGRTPLSGAPASPNGGVRRGRWADAAFALGTAILALLFFREFVFHAERMLFGSDMILEGLPLRRFALEELRAGRGLPGWNPYLNGGHPFLATLPGPLFYPSSLLYLALPLHRAIGWTFVLHLFLAGAFAYFAARAFRFGRSAAAVCGLAFMFSGYLLSTLYGGHDGRMFAIVLIPLALGLLERGLRSGEAGWFLGLAAALALQLLTPHAQVMYFSSLALVAYAAFRLWEIHRTAAAEPAGGRSASRVERGPARAAQRAPWRRALWVAGAFGLAAGLAAVQIVPTAALLEHVVRAAAEEGYEFAASWALPPQEVTALFLPDLIGGLDTYWGANPFKLHTEYLGAVPIALAVVAVAASVGGRVPGEPASRGTVWFLGGASLVGILFALGGATPVHRVAYAAIPLMDSFRAPSMMLAPVSAFVALLAGVGWERIRTRERPLSAWALGGVAAPFLVLGLAALLAPGGLLNFVYHAWFPGGWPRTPPAELEGALRTSGGFLVAAWVLVLAAAWAARRGGDGPDGAGKEGSRPRRRGLPRWALPVLLLVLVADLWRVDARFVRTAEATPFFTADGPVAFLQESLEPGERALPVEGTYHPNDLMRHDVPTVAGTQKFLLSWYAELVGGVGFEALFRHPVLWPMFDLRYLTTRSELDVPLLRPVGFGGRPGAEIRMYEVAEAAPHAWFPERISAVTEPEEAVRRTLALSDGRAEAVVEASEAPPAGRGTARLTRWTADEVVLSVSAEREGLLFVSEVWAPGWSAGSGGRALPLYRTNGAFRGVLVPAGEHEVRLSYRVPGLALGRVLSAASLAGLVLGAGWLAIARRRSRRTR